MKKENKQKSELEKDIKTEFQNDMLYGDYLCLDRILSSQHCLSDHHDEMLFIVIHQTSELWIKLIIHELSAAVECIQNNHLDSSFKMLSRIYWDLYELAEKLVDIGSQQQLWRYQHMSTVERIIGNKKGTGGSSGVTYLKRLLDHQFFPELWSLRTKL